MEIIILYVIADQVALLGVDKYIDTIKDNMFAIMDAEIAEIGKEIIAALNATPGGIDWLKKDGQADSKSPILSLLKTTPSLEKSLGWLFCIALNNVSIAYQRGIPFLHKKILACNGIAWDSFIVEEAATIKDAELENYLRSKI